MNLNKKALGVAVAVALLSTSAFAVSPYGNTNQKGSLLVFPLIDISDGKDTLIRITNDYSSDVDIKCYYQSTDRGNYKVKYRADLSFNLTKFQPGHWWASTGRSSGYADKGFNVRRFGDMPSNGAADKDGYVARGYPEVGELKCWAVNRGLTAPVSWNHLVGSATVFDREAGTATEYNAWVFQALPLNGTPRTQVGTIVGSEVTMRLNGQSGQYDFMPRTNIGQFSPVGLRRGDHHPSAADREFAYDWTKLYIAAGHQDFRQGAAAIVTKYGFTFWNQDESGFTGEHLCGDSWLELDLKKLWSATYEALGTDSAYYRVESFADRNICGNSPAPEVVGMVGVQVHGTYGKSGRDVAESRDARNIFVRAVPTHGRGSIAGSIEWDAGSDSDEVKAGN